MLNAKRKGRGHGKYIVGSIKLKIPVKLLELKRANFHIISLYFRRLFYKNVF
jgi:hypothetical protein